MKKQLEGAALELPPGLMCSGPCEPLFWKNDLPANFFFACRRKHNDIEKNATFGVNPHSWLNLFYNSVVCFLLPKCMFFLPMVFVMFFITTVCFYNFCKTVLVKKYTPCQGVVWFFAPKCHNLNTDFSVILYLNNLSPIKPQKTWKKKVEGAALKHLLGLICTGSCEPIFWKNDLPANLFLQCISPKSVMNLHWLFNMSYINTHFDMFFTNWGMYGCHIFLDMC